MHQQISTETTARALAQSDRIPRRQILAGIAQLPLVVLAASSSWVARAHAAQNCSDPDNLSSGEQELRKSLEYTETAPDAKKTCSGCSFFKPQDKSPCGTCQILNGPANSKGHCMSWSPKAA